MRSDADKIKELVGLPVALRPIVLGAILSRLFTARGVDLIIVGGAAVQYYVQAEYVTKDLDAVLRGADREITDEVMGRVGFVRTSSYRHYVHPDFTLPVEFPPSPIEVGDRIISQVNQIKTDEGPVQIVRVEDLIMDRITAAVVWKDRPSLDQAKLLWVKNKDQIDRKYLTQFAKEEGYLKVLKEVTKL